MQLVWCYEVTFSRSLRTFLHTPIHRATASPDTIRWHCMYIMLYTLCYTLGYSTHALIHLCRWILRASPSPLSCCSLPPESPPVAVFRGAGGGVLLEESCQSLRPWSNETDRNSYSTFSMISDRINYWMSQALFIAWTSLLLILFTRCNATSLSWP